MDKLRLQATAYLFSRELPDELVSRVENAEFGSMTELVEILITQDLEPWQFCYIEEYNPSDEAIPEYIVAELDTETVIDRAEELISRDSPSMGLETPFTQSGNYAESAREEYAMSQVNLYKEGCIRSVLPTLKQFAISATKSETVEEETLRNIAEDLVDEVGVWRWHLLTKQGRQLEYDAPEISKYIIAQAPRQLSEVFKDYDFDIHIDRAIELEEKYKSKIPKISKIEDLIRL